MQKYLKLMADLTQEDDASLLRRLASRDRRYSKSPVLWCPRSRGFMCRRQIRKMSCVVFSSEEIILGKAPNYVLYFPHY